MAELTFNTSLGIPKTSGDGIYAYIEAQGSPEIEVFRVKSSNASDWFFSRRFKKIKSIMIQNHGATFATGVARDPPKVIATQGTATANAKVTITHTATAEFFSVIVFGEL